MIRQMWHICVAGIILILVSISPAWASLAEIVSLSGKGEYRERSQSAWQAAQVKQELVAESFVRTGDLSAMAILFTDRTQIRLSQNSVLQIKGVEATGTDTAIRLNKGRAWSQAKKPSPRLVMETPSAIAAIRGTDWEMEVDEEGRARLTVLHGEVEFYNDQGRVTVRDNEQAWAEQGKAPLKLLLQNPAGRVQWVTAYTVDAKRYSELKTPGNDDEMREISTLLLNQRMAETHASLLRMAHASRPAPAVVFLLLADFAIYSGELTAAEDWLLRGMERFADDPRFPAHLARVKMHGDDMAGARRYLASGLARHPGAAELSLAQGDIARFEGEGKLAENAYRDALKAAPDDSRGWHGLGVVESEREDIRHARPHLLRALELDQHASGTRGELGTLETFANKLDAARKHYDLALQVQPDDYVALTGLGLLQLKRGDTGQALQTLLRANVIEPRYARAVVYAAIAYHQLGQHRVALQTLARAAELDRRDPLPHLLSSMIHSDLVEPDRAIEEAREAMRLMPYLKSLNQVANNQKGAANLGNALAQFGLEDWALNYAQQSYNSFWAGSHLFLADRYGGKFNKNSELMQGYLTDPTAFGAANRFQTLLPRPGNYFSLGATASRSDDLRTTTPILIANGYANSAFPLAWFAEGMRIHLTPGALALGGDGSNISAALGLAPREDLGFFIFANSFDADIRMQNSPHLANRTSGWENRVDLGMNYKFSPTSQSWLKLGAGQEKARNITSDNPPGRNATTQYDCQPRNRDIQYRHSLRLDKDEWTWGAESARMDKDVWLALDSITTSNAMTTQAREHGNEADQAWSLYLSDRRQLDSHLFLDAGLHYQRYDKTVSSTTRALQNGATYTDARSAAYAGKGLYPRLGLAYSPTASEVWRLAYQKWLRSSAANTLSPVASAGIPLDDQIVLPGGELERLRLQWERELSPRTFAALFLDAKRIHNLGQPGNVLNQREEVADLDRLRNRAAMVFQTSGETLEQPPAFLEGRIFSAGASYNRRLAENLSGTLNYVHRESENTHPWFEGFKLPYLPRHQFTLGTTWVGPQRLVVQAQAVYRSQRFSNENNNAELAAGWDAALKANWQSADKRWLMEGYGTSLLQKGTASTIGINAVWRY